MKENHTTHKHHFKVPNIRFRERMLLIYLIGGIIPFILVSYFTNWSVRNQVAGQNKEAQSEEISLICSNISESIVVAEKVSKHICDDEKLKRILYNVVQKRYKDKEELDKDCTALSFIDQYEEYFQEEISSINICVRNAYISNKYILYLDSSDSLNYDWYYPTYYNEGKPYWSYGINQSNQKVMQMTRAIRNEKGETLGMLKIELQMDKIKKTLSDRSENTLLLYNNDEVIIDNDIRNKELNFLYKNLIKYKGVSGTKEISHGVQDYYLSFERVIPADSHEYFTVVTLQSYQNIMADTLKMTFINAIVVLLGILASVLLIFCFSTIYQRRIQTLRTQMHLVANGEYDKIEPMTGSDEISQIYQELELMIHDIQTLTLRVAEEKVQKEMLHTKQREVEYQILASQINPHFLYNTLETIRMKAKMNHQDEIEELVKKLAKIMRRNIQVRDQMVTLDSEIELIENYLVIQGYRFGDRIQSEVIVDENVDRNCMVIPLIMQPFVENAYIHGLESKEKGGLLLIHVMQTGGDIQIEIKDNGIGMDFYRLGKIRQGLREGKSVLKGHIGITNVNQRLRILYGDSYGVTIHSQLYKGTTVMIRFPGKLPAEIKDMLS